MDGSTGSRTPPAAKVLMDTHTFVWELSEPELLSDEARRLLPDSEVAASVASLWELPLKKGKPGALVADLVPWWEKFVVRPGIRVLSIRQSHVIALGRLGNFHKDPFDRILVAQAIVEGASLVSKDSG